MRQCRFRYEPKLVFQAARRRGPQCRRLYLFRIGGDQATPASRHAKRSGRCQWRLPGAGQPQPPANAPGNPSPAPAPDAASLLGGGVALGMNECDVVLRAGQPSSVQIGQNPNGDRTALLTFNAGPRPGVYRFERGVLTEMDRAAQASNPPPPPEKKKASKSAKPQRAAIRPERRPVGFYLRCFSICRTPASPRPGPRVSGVGRINSSD